MDKPIVAVAGDPGGANALAPVLVQLQKAGIAPLQPLAYREALSLWRRRGLTPEPIDGDGGGRLLVERIRQAGLLLAATSANGVDREREAIAVARRFAVPSLALLDFWSNYRLRFANREGGLILPDRIAVMDALAAEEMAAAGFPVERLEITGQPAFDDLPARLAAFSPARRQQLRRELDLADGDCLVLYVSQPLGALYGSPGQARQTIGFSDEEVLALSAITLADLATRHRRRLVMAIRRHPRETRRMAPPAQGQWFRAVNWDGVEKCEAALGADLVLGMNSILLMEAVYLGQIVVSVQPGLKIPDPLPCNRAGSSIVVTESAALEQTLELAVFNDRWRMQHLITLAASRRTSAAQNATERVVRAALQLLERTHHQ